MDFGPYEGWSEEALAGNSSRGDAPTQRLQLPGVESEADVEARAQAFFSDLESASETTLVVGHGRMLRILIATCVLGVAADTSGRLRMRNCQPAIVEPGIRPLLLGFNLAIDAART